MIRSRNEGSVVGTPASVGMLDCGLNGGVDGLGPIPRTELGESCSSSVVTLGETLIDVNHVVHELDVAQR